MSRIWTAPKTYIYKDVMTATVNNQQLRDNLEYLKMKPRNYAALVGVANDALSLTTSLAAVNDLNWSCSITTSEVNEEVFLYLSTSANVATGAQFLVLDVLMDGTTYVSSGTATPTLNGISSNYMATTNSQSINFRFRVVIPSVGTHTFKLRARVSTTTCVTTFFTLSVSSTFGVQVE